MDPARKASLLRYALREQLLTERDEQLIGHAGQEWSDEAIEIITTWIETARESGFLAGLGQRKGGRPVNGDRPPDTGLDGWPGNSGPGW